MVINGTTRTTVTTVINRPGDISDGRSNGISQRSKVLSIFTILFGVFSAWLLWKRVAKGERKGSITEVDDHGPENAIVEEKYQEGDHLMIDDTSIAKITLLDNGSAIHTTLVIMNGLHERYYGKLQYRYRQCSTSNVDLPSLPTNPNRTPLPISQTLFLFLKYLCLQQTTMKTAMQQLKLKTGQVPHLVNGKPGGGRREEEENWCFRWGGGW